MSALGQDLIRTNGDLIQVNYERVKLTAMQSRTRYYGTRLTPFEKVGLKQGGGHNLPGEIMAGLDKNFGSEAIEERISQTLQKYRIDPASQEGFDGVNFDTFLRNGLIHAIGDQNLKVYHCPIPSLKSYTVASAGGRVHLAAYGGNEQSMRMVLGMGEDLNGQAPWCQTPLHIAAENNWEKMVDVLLMEGADPEICDRNGNRPLEVAREGTACHSRLRKISKTHGTTNESGNTDRTYHGDGKPYSSNAPGS